MILFVNACVRTDSRTLKLAKALISKFQGDVQEVKLIKAVGLDIYGADPEGIIREAIEELE